MASKESKKRISKSNKGNIREDARKRMENNNPNKIIVICPYCDKEGGKSNMKRWHFENCRYKNV